ncbi:MAG: LPP20 family lipoprotein [Alphaproteobacteria bacterium]|tara:strand:+ start:1030 stop:1539 length:510 start_codon:yes stop_codon:yes gene_type:complete
MKKLLFIVLTIFLQSCNGNLMSGFNNSQFSNASNEKIDDYSTPTNQLNKTRELLDGASINFPTLTATGYAVVSTQPGQNVEQKRLMAIRAARMAAMRELAEQIHGLKVDSNTTVIDLMVQNDTFRGIVSGVIRGARTVRINPTGSDTYETVLEIDQDMVAYLFRQAQVM